MQRFVGKTVIVTGAASGFGKAMTRRFCAEGATVIAADINEAGAQALAKDIGEAAVPIKADVSQSDDIKAMVDLAVARGGIDVLVNNAGFSHLSGPPWQLEESEFERVFATNVKGVWLGVKHAVPHMIEAGGGVILNTASIGAIAPRPGVTVYNATKGAVMTMTMGLAVELARHRIRVNAMNPVAAETGFMRGALGVDELPDANREAIIRGIPLRRLTEPADVAASAAFLASDEASFLTGVCLPIDGGRSIS
ncbi:MAG: glucose 1-dehydrogenase [Gammaproteobacteria bacterium]|nr:glucose 1-dehydrogenase [Gammaproteobacteria bacterium]